MTIPFDGLPPSTSPTLALVEATPEEKLATWRLNGQSWAGRLSVDAYLRREEHLADQEVTRNGGIMYWILVDATKAPNERAILSSCETLRKRALVARAEPDGDGDVEEVLSHGVGSVYTDPRYRGKGYATRMLSELAKKLDTWHLPNGRRSEFTVLYSDIGKKFYSKSGWNPFPSSHIALPALEKDDVEDRPKVHLMKTEDLAMVCEHDEGGIIKKGLVGQSAKAGKTMVALIPNKETMRWHHAREEFFAKEVLGKEPVVKGSYITGSDHTRNWCIWSRFFGTEASGDVLHILRFGIEGQDDLVSLESEIASSDQTNKLPDQKLAELAALLRAAQLEAFEWNIKEVQLWNPTSWAFQAAQSIDPSVKIVHRGEESIASLRWHGSEPARDIEWLGNEKYGWC